jgi:hypothetical protein
MPSTIFKESGRRTSIVVASSQSNENNRIAQILASVITGAWAISFIVDIVIKEYDPSPSVHALMMIVAGAVFGEGLIRKRNGETPEPKPQKESEDAS